MYVYYVGFVHIVGMYVHMYVIMRNTGLDNAVQTCAQLQKQP